MIGSHGATDSTESGGPGVPQNSFWSRRLLLNRNLDRPMENPDITTSGGLTQKQLDKPIFKHQELTRKIIGVFYDVYNELGHGFLESVYEAAMLIALREAGLKVETQVSIAVYFRGNRVGDFRADLMVESAVLLELKAARALDPSHEAQLLNYLRATEIEVGLLLNFGVKPEFKRLAFHNERKRPQINADERR
jgi:GxxExxY protein